jgi:hypothetical protein
VSDVAAGPVFETAADALREKRKLCDMGITDRTFEIAFPDPGVQAYVFTFG